MQAIIDFVLELERLKAVTRKIRLRESGRLENSAEHSWQLALFAFSLRDCAPGGVYFDRVIRMLLVHDLGEIEIEIGDTMAFVEVGLEQRKRDERAAVTQLFGALPERDGDELLALWEEFEDAVTTEARFAHAIDRAMPVLHNLANAGQSWRENRISFERVVRRIRPPIETGCPALWEYLEPRLHEALARGWFGAGNMPEQSRR